MRQVLHCTQDPTVQYVCKGAEEGGGIGVSKPKTETERVIRAGPARQRDDTRQDKTGRERGGDAALRTVLEMGGRVEGGQEGGLAYLLWREENRRHLRIYYAFVKRKSCHDLIIRYKLQHILPPPSRSNETRDYHHPD